MITNLENKGVFGKKVKLAILFAGIVEYGS